MGLDIADFQLRIFDWSFPQHQSAIPRSIRIRDGTDCVATELSVNVMTPNGQRHKDWSNWHASGKIHPTSSACLSYRDP
jgi:hypothetical protein